MSEIRGSKSNLGVRLIQKGFEKSEPPIYKGFVFTEAIVKGVSYTALLFLPEHPQITKKAVQSLVLGLQTAFYTLF